MYNAFVLLLVQMKLDFNALSVENTEETVFSHVILESSMHRVGYSLVVTACSLYRAHCCVEHSF